MWRRLFFGKTLPPLGHVVEVWKAVGVVSFELPNPERQPGMPQITALLTELKQEVEALKKGREIDES